jgi:CBS domain-containing protein
VVIGHSIRYDLEVLRREAERAGGRWPERPSLDVRVLARLATETLADYSLDGLCAWLGIGIDGRHSAHGDAVATARVFAALVPMLRRRGIRTLAEAEAACRAVEQREAPMPASAPSARDTGAPLDVAALERIDSYPYRHRVHEVMSSPPAVLPADRTLGDALEVMITRGISSVFVADEAAETGIVTERDVLRTLHARGADALSTPLRAVRNAPLHGVSADDFVYRAIGRMDRLGIRHLAALDADGGIAGALTTRNLLRHRASAAMILGDEIGTAGDEATLGAVWGRVPLAVRLLCDEGVDPRQAASVVSAEIAMLTKRAAEIGEARMRDAGRGAPPVPYALLLLGSAGRGESLLAADQDNAIVFASGEPGGPEDRWFEELAGHVADILDRVGVPYCKGGVMARNAPWRRSLADWKATVAGWVGRQSGEDLLNVDIFFDAVPVHGDEGLGEEVWSHAYACGARVPAFWLALQEMLAGWRPPVGLFGGFRTGADDRVDLKAGGLMPIFTAARILSIKTGTQARATPDRLRAAVTAGLASERWLERVTAAHQTLLGAILRQQLADIAAGIPPGPRVAVARLTRHERAELRQAVQSAGEAVSLVREGIA